MRNKKILEKKLEEAFSITKLNTSAKKFHIGDRVLLPNFYHQVVQILRKNI